MTGALLQALQRRTNHRGLVVVRETALLEELDVSADVLRTAVARLADERRVKILSPLPFLVVKWCGSEARDAESGPKTGAVGTRVHSFQSSLSQLKQMKESYRQPADEAALLEEILTTLGETDPLAFRGAIRHYPAEVIRLTLDRIRRMPTIRKNPTALFRYLLPRIAKEPRFKT